MIISMEEKTNNLLKFCKSKCHSHLNKATLKIKLLLILRTVFKHRLQAIYSDEELITVHNNKQKVF